jgi:membrane protease YdiL (CAAX protease family)
MNQDSNLASTRVLFLRDHKIETAILLFLLVTRLADTTLPQLIFGAEVTPPWFLSLYTWIVYVLVAWLLWLNRNELSSLNIDKASIILFIVSGFLLTFFYIRDLSGWIPSIAALIILDSLRKNKFSFVGANSDRSLRKHWYLPLLVLLIAVPVCLYNFRSGYITPLNLQSVSYAFLEASLPSIVFEEMIFRAGLWRFLKALGIGDLWVFFIQAFFFWISHHHMLADGQLLDFWIVTPLISLILGYIVLKSKSITLSTIGHLFYNFLIAYSAFGR